MGRSNGEELRNAARQHDWTRLYGILSSNPYTESSGEHPVHSITLDGYWIYKYEVTVQQYRSFCRSTKRAMPSPPIWGWQDNRPIINVNWNDAAAYAAWAGAALPTEAQWEKAARGPEGQVYPWGNTWDGKKCRHTVDYKTLISASAVGSFPSGASPYGAQDMAGNVWEWCADWYAAEYYQHTPRLNPKGPITGTWRVTRGGSWSNYNPVDFRTTCRGRYKPGNRDSRIGFRCVVRLPGP
jgi:formylglycine-generating enzyme required for sulfatase activity